MSDLLEKIKQTKLSAMSIAEQTGIPVGRIYKWLDGTARPKTEDSKKLEAFLEKVPREQVNFSNEELNRKMELLRNELLNIKASLGVLEQMVDLAVSKQTEKSMPIVSGERLQAVTMAYERLVADFLKQA